MLLRLSLWLAALICLTVSSRRSADAADRTSQPVPTGQLPCFGFDDNFPSRIDAVTRLRYAVPGDDRTVLEVYDINGQRVALLLDATQAAGSHSILWNGRDHNGTPTSSGVYFIRLRSGDYSEIRKIIVIREKR